jgi:hypothetical protein
MKKLLIASIFSLAFYNVQAQYADCDNAIFLCSKERVLVKSLKGAGTNKDELSMLSCSEKLNEVNSAWMKFQVIKGGSLDFTIFPLQQNDDIDFVIFRIYDEGNTCISRRELRCMASGINKGESNEINQNCLGMTGLSSNSNDIRESAGCDKLKDNFLSTLQLNKGETYSIAINNYSSEKGFLIEFNGTAEFGALPNYAVVNSSEIMEADNNLLSFKYNTENAAQEEIQDNLAAGLQLKGLPIESMVKDIEPLKISNKKMASISCSSQPSKSKNTLAIPLQLSGKANDEIILGDPFPTPTQDEVNIFVNSRKSALTRVEITDLYGRVIQSNIEYLDKGSQKLSYNISNFTIGTYFIYFYCDNFQATKKIVKIK